MVTSIWKFCIFSILAKLIRKSAPKAFFGCQICDYINNLWIQNNWYRKKIYFQDSLGDMTFEVELNYTSMLDFFKSSICITEEHNAHLWYIKFFYRDITILHWWELATSWAGVNMTIRKLYKTFIVRSIMGHCANAVLR